MSAQVGLDELCRSLAGIVGEPRVSTRPADRMTYARDTWPRLLLAVRAGAPAEHAPDLVVWPETAEEIVEIVRLARRMHVPVVPYGAGSGVTGAAVPLYGGISLDLKRMDRVLSVNDADLVVEAEAGINGERFERELARRGYALGHFPSSIYCSTLGGWLAARSAGQMSTRYGKIEDMTLGLTAVTGRGELITTGRHGRAAAGPDWTQLLIGSEGTLAVITSARLRIHRAPETRVFHGFAFPDVAAGLDAIRHVLQRGLRPAVVRLYDEFDSLVFMHSSQASRAAADRRKRPEPPRPCGGALPSLSPMAGQSDDGDDFWERLRTLVPGANLAARLERGAMLAALDRPRALNALAETFAEHVIRRGCLLIVGFEGPRARTEIEAGLAIGGIAHLGGRDLGEEPGRRWYETRYTVSYGMAKVFEKGAFVDTMEVATTWARLLDLYECVRRAISRHAFVMAHFSHAYPEGCSIYFTFAGHAPTRERAEAKYDAIWRDGLTAATRAGGTISHHHGVGLLKAPFMAAEHRESMAVFQGLKRSFDPDGILNPGKMGLAPLQGKPWPTITRN